MRRLASTLYLFVVLLPCLALSPSAIAAPEQYTLGAEVAPPNTLPAVPPAKPVKGKPTVKPKVEAGTKKPKAKIVAASTAGKRAGKPASKSKSRKKSDAIATELPKAKIDLTLPKDMVDQLQAPGQPAPAQAIGKAPSADGKPLLPALFAPKGSGEPFELNGRLLTNEMDLQLRSENRRDVEGAAVDFKFRQ